MSSREPTLADVAQLAGVSPTTVSRVLNNRGYLSEKTKRSVADAIKTLGYRPNSLARALHGKSTQTVGLIVPAVSLPFFGELAVEVENALAEAGYRILICNSMGRAEREREYLSLLVGNRVDGIISGAHNEGLSEYDTIRMPLVTIDRGVPPSPATPLTLGPAQPARGRILRRDRTRRPRASHRHHSIRYAHTPALHVGAEQPRPGVRPLPHRRRLRHR